MSKVIFVLSLLGVGILFIFGLTDPNSPVVWLASTSTNFAILRAVLIVTLIALLVTNPPRNIYFRMFVGFLSLGLVSWALSATYQNEMKLLDSLAILEVSISAGLAILERQVNEEKAAIGRRLLEASA